MSDTPPPTLAYASARPPRRRALRMMLLVALVLVVLVALAVCAYALYVLSQPDAFKGMIS
jgi:hypothetical protein